MEENMGAVNVEMTENVPADEMTPERIKKVTVRIKGREIPLKYSTKAQIAIDEELEKGFDEIREDLNKTKKPNTRTVLAVIRILGNEGLRLAGEAADLTDEWLIENVIPKDIFAYRVAALTAIMQGWFMETDNSADEEQDLTLIELRKKKESTD